MGLITENNSQYYAGSQHVLGDGSNPISEASFTFDTPLSLGSAGSFANTDAYYALNNFKIYVSTDGGTTFVEWLTEYALKTSSTPDGSITSIVTFVGTIPSGTSIVVVQLKSLTGGQYGNRDAFGDTVEENYGSYSYLTLNEAVENYMVGFVGDGKIIQTAKKYDINFHAKRGLQEFSYDLLKSIKSQELSVPDNLSIPIPQDYVNYVKFSWVGVCVDGYGAGVRKHLRTIGTRVCRVSTRQRAAGLARMRHMIVTNALLAPFLMAPGTRQEQTFTVTSPSTTSRSEIV